mgnify:CR=1 FL=1
MPRRDTVKVVNLALQGGGAHGAFTWGLSTNFSRMADLKLKAFALAAPGP